MESIRKFNALNGRTVSREEIGSIIEFAQSENQTDVVFRLFQILNNNPFDSNFEITSLKVYPEKGLKGIQHTGDYRLALDNCGRLRPGFKFENGHVVKVPEVKKKATEKKPKSIVQQKAEKPKVERKRKDQRMTKKEFYKSLIASDQKEFNKKIEYIEGYLSLEDTLNKISDKLVYWKETEDQKKIELLEKEADRIRKSSDLQVVQGAKFFKIEPIEFLYMVSDYTEDKTAFKKAILPSKRQNINKTRQTSLFGAKKGLKSSFVEDSPEVKQETTVLEEKIPDPVKTKVTVLAKVEKTISNNPKVQKIGATSNEEPSEFYTVAGEVGKFLQQVEKKPVHSVVITLDGEQGAGKTTMLYMIMEAFALPGNNCLFISGEEHPSSSLAKEKVKNYLSPEAQNNIDTVGEVKDVEELYNLIKPYDIIFIDSWQKLLRMVGLIQLDEDLRKRFDGKVFVIIFQQTTTGRTKGGAEVVFDGDIITKLVKTPRFSDNYAYFDKNRYTLVPLETIRFNIASGEAYNPEAPKQCELPKLSFTAIEI